MLATFPEVKLDRPLKEGRQPTSQRIDRKIVREWMKEMRDAKCALLEIQTYKLVVAMGFVEKPRVSRKRDSLLGFDLQGLPRSLLLLCASEYGCPNWLQASKLVVRCFHKQGRREINTASVIHALTGVYRGPAYSYLLSYRRSAPSRRGTRCRAENR